jgi:hypothetical protein
MRYKMGQAAETDPFNLQRFLDTQNSHFDNERSYYEELGNEGQARARKVGREQIIMDKIFVASSFQDSDRTLVEAVAAILYSLGLQPTNGRNLGGEPLDDAVRERIEQTDGLVALFTRRDQEAWSTHPWVMGEFGHAISTGRRSIALVDNSLDWTQTMWAGRQYIILDRNAPSVGLLKLVDELGTWKREAGTSLTVTLAQRDLLEEFRTNGDRFRIRYRCWHRAQHDNWRSTDRFYFEGAAIVVNMPSIPSTDHLVEIEVSVQGTGKRWTSPALRQFLPVDLTEARQ